MDLKLVLDDGTDLEIRENSLSIIGKHREEYLDKPTPEQIDTYCMYVCNQVMQYRERMLEQCQCKKEA